MNTVRPVVPESIIRLIPALACGDRSAVESLVSDDFGMHDGLDRGQWIARELDEFERRIAAIGVSAVRVVPGASISHGHRFAVLCDRGHFIYEDVLDVAKDGKIRGLGRQFEIVTKLLFPHGASPCRALAIRSPRADIVSCVPLDGTIDRHAIAPGMLHDEDRFSTVTLVLVDDDLRERDMRLRIRDAAGVSCTETVRLRGTDTPYFGPCMRPRIEGATLILPDASLRIWSATVALADGTVHSYEHPHPGAIETGGEIVHAVLTDALDNDWHAEAA